MSHHHNSHGTSESHGSLDNYDLVSDQLRIVDALSEINRRLVLVGVRLDSEGPLYDSRIVRIAEDTQAIFLLPLEPSEETPRIAPDQDLFVFATIRGIAVRFTTTVTEIPQTESGLLYKCSYPEQLLYLQRRDLFRAQLPRHEQRQVKIIPTGMDREITARIIDLSVRGFCLEVEVSEIGEDQLGLLFHYQGMELPDTRGRLSGEATLVNLRPSPSSDHLSAGFVITDLDPLTERALMRAALYFQRRLGG